MCYLYLRTLSCEFMKKYFCIRDKFCYCVIAIWYSAPNGVVRCVKGLAELDAGCQPGDTKVNRGNLPPSLGLNAGLTLRMVRGRASWEPRQKV